MAWTAVALLLLEAHQVAGQGPAGCFVTGSVVRPNHHVQVRGAAEERLFGPDWTRPLATGRSKTVSLCGAAIPAHQGEAETQGRWLKDIPAASSLSTASLTPSAVPPFGWLPWQITTSPGRAFPTSVATTAAG